MLVEQSVEPGLFGLVLGNQWGVREKQLSVGLPPPQSRGRVMLIDKIRIKVTDIMLPSRHNMQPLDEVIHYWPFRTADDFPYL